MVLQEFIQINSWLKMDFWTLMQIDSLLKNSPEFFIQMGSWLNKQNLYLNQLNDGSMMLFIPSFVWPFWAFDFTDNLARPFLGFPFKCWLHMTIFGLCAFPKNWFESDYGSSSILETWIDSAHNSSGFPWIDSELTHDSSGFSGIDSDWLTTKNASRFFDSNQLMTQVKKHLILNRLMIRLWVIPMSVGWTCWA